MWTVVYITHEEKSARLLVSRLREHGILSRMRRIGKGRDYQECEVLVPQPEVNYAQDIIIDNELF